MNVMHMRPAAAVSLLALVMFSACARQGSVRWKNVPFIAGEKTTRNDHLPRPATGIKMHSDWENVYVQVHGYTQPSELRNVIVNTATGPRAFESRLDTWTIMIDSDALMAPRMLVFAPGAGGTLCSQRGVEFTEHLKAGVLEIAVPRMFVASSPVYVRAEHTVGFIVGGREVTRLRYPFPAEGAVTWEAPTLPPDQRVPQVSDVSAVEIRHSRAVLRWISNKRLTSRLELAPQGRPLKMQCDDQQPKAVHEVQLDKLQPDTEYRFRVGGRAFDGSLAEPAEGSFRTAVADARTAELDRLGAAWQPVQLAAPEPAAGDGRSLGGVWIQPERAARWRTANIMPAGTYRLSVHMWHRKTAGEVAVFAVRSSIGGPARVKVHTIQPCADAKLHHHDIHLKLAVSFDELVLESADAAGPVTTLEFYALGS